MNTPLPIEVLGIGAPIVDQVIHVSDDFLAAVPGKKGGMEPISHELFCDLLRKTGQNPELLPGGSCANTIRGLASLGHTCGLIGKIGNDDIGAHFVDNLRHLGIASFYNKSRTPTGRVLSFVTPDGERTCRTFLGACAEMSADDLEPDRFQKVRLVHIEGYTLNYPGLTRRVMEYAKNAGATISFDLASFEIVELYKKEILDLLVRYVDICFANKVEAYELTRLAPEQACAYLKELCSIAIVSMNKEGCWIGQKTELLRCPAYPVEPLDSTGAGDLFASGFLHGYLTDKPLGVSAHYGALAGAAIVQLQGASLPQAQWEALKAQIS